jgi:hypothetical protein
MGAGRLHSRSPSRSTPAHRQDRAHRGRSGRSSSPPRMVIIGAKSRQDRKEWSDDHQRDHDNARDDGEQCGPEKVVVIPQIRRDHRHHAQSKRGEGEPRVPIPHATNRRCRRDRTTRIAAWSGERSRPQRRHERTFRDRRSTSPVCADASGCGRRHQPLRPSCDGETRDHALPSPKPFSLRAARSHSRLSPARRR